MFGKKLKLKSIIDKHQEFFQPTTEIPKDDTPPPPISDGNLKHDVALDISADAFECLLYGFIRRIVSIIPNISNNNVSDDIIRLCLTFYNTGFENLKFNLFNIKYCETVYDVILKASSSKSVDAISCHRVFTSSVGYSLGIHKWKIQYIVDDDKSLTSPYGGIGIISDNKILRKDDKWGNYRATNVKSLNWINNKNFGNVYYLDQGSDCIYNYQSGRGKVLYSTKYMKDKSNSYKKGDIITIILDCNRWKLKILKNDENILIDDKEIDIKKKYITYYPVIAFYHHGDTYRVLTK